MSLSVKVTQGDEAVDDADSVEFEVWESGMRDAREMIEGNLTEDGVYEANIHLTMMVCIICLLILQQVDFMLCQNKS